MGGVQSVSLRGIFSSDASTGVDGQDWRVWDINDGQRNQFGAGHEKARSVMVWNKKEFRKYEMFLAFVKGLAEGDREERQIHDFSKR